MFGTESSLISWIHHRLGDKVAEDKLPQYVTKALEQNADFVDYADTVGKKNISGFVGFIDLEGYSTATSGMDPTAVRDYLWPFLNTAIGLLTRNWCLIDKTIGDEIMFLLPEGNERHFPPATIRLLGLLTELKEFGTSNDHDYHFRICISMGDLLLDRIGNDEYREAAAFGETINVAKRLMSIEELAAPDKPLCAIGAKVGKQANRPVDELEQLLQLLTKFHRHWSLKQHIKEIDLKGVGAVRYGILEANKP